MLLQPKEKAIFLLVTEISFQTRLFIPTEKKYIRSGEHPRLEIIFDCSFDKPTGFLVLFYFSTFFFQSHSHPEFCRPSVYFTLQ